MASVSEYRGGKKRIQFWDRNGKRRTLWLGEMDKRAAEEVCRHVEALNVALVTGATMPDATARWLAGIGVDLAKKLARAGLTQPRVAWALGDHCERYIASRKACKEGTRALLVISTSHLIAFLGERALRDVTAGDAERYSQHLKAKGLAPATVSRYVKHARQIFQAAVDDNMIQHNPFRKVKANDDRKMGVKGYVNSEDAKKLIDAIPDPDIALVVALARFGGLRTPSETFALRWAEVKWDLEKIWVRSPKTEHHPGSEGRWVPMFATLRPYLTAAFERATEGEEYVIPLAKQRTQYRQMIRYTVQNAILRAGLVPWPKLFNTLRSSCEVDLCERLPIHLVAQFMGHSVAIAAKHYLRVRDEDYVRAARDEVAPPPRSVVSVF